MVDQLPSGARVVVIRFGALGDVVLASAAVHALRAKRPDIHVVCLTKTAYRDVFACIDGVEVWCLGEAAGLRGLVELASRVQAWSPHLVVDLHATLRAAVLRMLLVGTPWRRVHKRTVSRWLNVRFKFQPRRAPHTVEKFAAAIGVEPPEGGWLRTSLACGERVVAGKIGLVPGAAWHTKRWPIDRWRELGQALSRAGANVVWVGGAGEAAWLEELAATAGGETAVGRPLDELSRLLAGCEVVVANDTGPGHLAAAVGRPVVTLLGPTVASYGYLPWGTGHRVVERQLACRPCTFHGGDACPQGHHACMEQIDCAAVLVEIERIRSRRDAAVEVAA